MINAEVKSGIKLSHSLDKNIVFRDTFKILQISFFLKASSATLTVMRLFSLLLFSEDQL